MSDALDEPSEVEGVNAARDVYTAGRDMTINVVPTPIARSAYLHQVRLISPAELIDRDEELAELARFWTSESQGTWAWWRGPAWSGKSALMAWFVLHPPPRVRIVSFFITARWAGHSDRQAFVNVVIEQLAEVARRAALIARDAALEAARISARGQTRTATIAAVACLAAALIAVSGSWWSGRRQQVRTQPGPTVTVTVTVTSRPWMPSTHMI